MSSKLVEKKICERYDHKTQSHFKWALATLIWNCNEWDLVNFWTKIICLEGKIRCFDNIMALVKYEHTYMINVPTYSILTTENWK